MASVGNKSVIVLAPNGRRQTVKVTPNTTILQILEEVCKKQGLEPHEYDLKHHKNVLDTTIIIRFSGLPNNAQLEMCAAKKDRRESSVTLGVQLENGERLTGDFSPGDKLFEILTTLCPEELRSDIVAIYMRNEMYGVEPLKNTSLRSLGLTGGRAMLRIMHRTPEQLKTQANVSSAIAPKPQEEKPYIRKKVEPYAEQNRTPDVKMATNTNVNLQTKMKVESQRNDASNESIYSKGEVGQKTPKTNLNDLIKQEKDKAKQQKQLKIMEPMEVDEAMREKRNNKKKLELPENFTYLGDRHAMAFSLEQSEAVPHEELPDEFFELTIQDAKKLYRDLKSKRQELEDRPLYTNQLRNLEKEKKLLRQINQYGRVVIRVQFPDRTVLQGSFRPLETIKHVQNFIREYLRSPELDFYLYTTPPKIVLMPDSTLVDCECVPSAVLYFGSNQAMENGKILKEELFNRFVSPSMASIAASRSITNHKRQVEPETPEDENVNVGASTSKSPTTAMIIEDGSNFVQENDLPIQRQTVTSDEPKSKLPKWFKTNK